MAYTTEQYEALKDAADRLVDAMHDIMEIDEANILNELPQACFDEYPFEDSFDEAYLRAMGWRDAIEEAVKTTTTKGA